MHLQGKSITREDAIREVQTTCRQLMSGEMSASTPLAGEPIETTDFKSRVPAIFEPGTMLGATLDQRYRIIKRLGAGGMGKVYLAEQQGTGRNVALKILQVSSAAEADRRARYFRQEASALARLNHHYITQVYDAYSDRDIFYIAMEYVDGESLRERLQREGKLSHGEALYWLRQACAGLAIAHEMAIIHRDIKPENLMLTWDAAGNGSLKILDFGLAIVDKMDADGALTAVGHFAGTVSYMSPEQIDAKEPTPASDVYSLGVLAYEMLAGSNPFEGRTMQEILVKHMSLRPPRLRDLKVHIPQQFETAILKALEKDPQTRFATAAEFGLAIS